MPKTDVAAVRDVLTPAQAAGRLQVTPITVYRWLWAGKLEACQDPSGRWWIKESLIDRILAGEF
jgi:excisionase family DNA binding protein